MSIDNHPPTHPIVNGVALEGGVVDLPVRAGGSKNSTAREVVDVCSINSRNWSEKSGEVPRIAPEHNDD
jgi:hypothetical protein